MPTEFELSIIDHSVASGREANCYFQSFFHILTSQSDEKLHALIAHYPHSIQALVDTFNQRLDLEPPISFHRIMEISRELHPLEREYVFGPILRHTYNTMVERNIVPGNLLQLNAIMLSTQTDLFANAFGAELKVYMSQEQLDLSINKMPVDVAERIKNTRFEIGDRVFYCDTPLSQSLNGPKIFEVDLIYADVHLNYTLGTRSLNNEHTQQIIAQKTETKDGIFAISAAPGSNAPLTKIGLSFSDILNSLCIRFALSRNIPTEEFKSDFVLPRPSDLASRRSSTAFMAREMNFTPMNITSNKVENEKLDAKSSTTISTISNTVTAGASDKIAPSSSLTKKH